MHTTLDIRVCGGVIMRRGLINAVEIDF